MINIKNTLWYTIIGGIFLIPFIPFIVAGSMYFPFITGKGFTFRIIVEIIFGLYVWLACIAPEYRPKMSWVTKAVGLFALATLVADLFGANVYKSLWSNYERMEGFVLIAHLVLYYITASSVLTRQWWNRFWNTSIVASVIMSLYGIMQLSGKLTINQGGVRVDGTFGNASYLAIYLVFHIFLCLYFWAERNQTSWKKWTYGLVAVLELVILYYTATRGAILGLLGGLVLTAVILALKEKEDIHMRKIAYGTLIVLAVGTLGFFAIRNASFVQKSPVLSRFATLSPAEIKTQGRYFVWPMAMKGFLEKPILGWGQENFNFVFNKNYDPRMYAQEQWFDRTHNIALDWLIAGGLIGFLSYISLYIVLFYFIWKKRDTDELSLAQKSLLTGMIGAYIFHNMFVFDNLISYILFFSVLGYVHTIRRSNTPQEGSMYPKMFSEVTNLYVIGPIVAVVIVGAVYFINVPAIQANTTLITALSQQQQAGGIEKNLTLFKQAFGYNSFGSSEILEQLFQLSAQVISSPQVPETVKQEFYTLTKEKIEQKILQTPNDARYRVFAGSFYNRAGSIDPTNYDRAIDELTKALELSPKKQSIYFELGAAYISKGNTAKALELFKQAYDLEPASTESKIIYAVGGVYAKNSEIVKTMFSQIDPSVIISDNRFLNAYASIRDIQSVITILNARIAKEPTNLQYKLSLASAYAEIGQRQTAVEILREIIKQEPSFKEQGEIYIKQLGY